MINIKQISTHYLTPNKTIEILSVSNSQGELSFHIYNYKGISYRVFRSQDELNGFWKGESDEHKHFQTEQELDNWLQSVVI
jgi:hypothetical protein